MYSSFWASVTSIRDKISITTLIDWIIAHRKNMRIKTEIFKPIKNDLRALHKLFIDNRPMLSQYLVNWRWLRNLVVDIIILSEYKSSVYEQ